MKEEFNLSEKIIDEGYYIPIKDVKEFIKKLKEKYENYTNTQYLHDCIDKLAGKDLT
ncbi:hypothetical protein LCGC14_1930690 [marine sediment metagenome]|uniref:Uncharacterized protein n=1 Tax=marine sediment metagenome TaxID=412755 RepID=A0A0F9GBK3_9ZZZZ